MIGTVRSSHTTSNNADYVKHHNNIEDKITKRQETVKVINKLSNWLNNHDKQLDKDLAKLPMDIKLSDIHNLIKNFETNTIIYIGTWSKEYVLGTRMTDRKLITDLLYKKLNYIDITYLSTIRNLRNDTKYKNKVMYYDKLLEICAKIRMNKRRN